MIWLFSMFIFNRIRVSINSERLFITRADADPLPTSIIMSSAYRTKLCPLRSNSLSSSSKTILDNRGDKELPCGVPFTRWLVSPPLSIPARRNLPISLRTRLSPRRVLNCHNKRSWLTSSKNFARSISTIQFLPCATLLLYHTASSTEYVSAFHRLATPPFVKKTHLRVFVFSWLHHSCYNLQNHCSLIENSALPYIGVTQYL